MILWTAFLMGLAGSVHCIGMCGPIAMALPLTSREKTAVIIQSLLYNLGRISTYAFMGFFFGLLGWGIALAGYQNTISIAIGIGLILAAVFTISIEQKILTQAIFTKGFNSIKNKLAQLLSIRGKASAFKIGFLNGLLPCGLVYVALAGSIATGNAWMGSLYMLAFGFGTLPLMFGVMIFGKWSKKWLSFFNRLTPYALVLFGAFLIYRGLVVKVPANLELWEAMNFPIMCH